MLFGTVIVENFPYFRKYGIPICEQTDPELFFPPKGGGQDSHDVNQAKKLCMSCPVQPECLDWAMDNNEFGIWGATSGHDRRTIRSGKMERPVSEASQNLPAAS